MQILLILVRKHEQILSARLLSGSPAADQSSTLLEIRVEAQFSSSGRSRQSNSAKLAQCGQSILKVILTDPPLKDNFSAEIIIAPSALRHGVSEEDATHAYRNAIVRWKFDEEFEMLIGADQTGRLLEVQ
jgi:hypothetical protein